MSHFLRRTPSFWLPRLAISVLGMVVVGGLLVSATRAAELEQFALDSHGNQLIVKLQTDSETPATVEYGQKGAVIHLKDASLSSQMVKQGLPMVMDAQNRFIGRAVPGGDEGGVKVVIPNVRPDQVTVKVNQVRQLETIGSIAPLQPESVSKPVQSQFRAAASAAQASLVPSSKPAESTTASVKPSASKAIIPRTSPPTTSVTLKPQVVSAKKPVKKSVSRRLPKVVSLTPPKPQEPEDKDVTLPKTTSTLAESTKSPTSSATNEGDYPADVSWFESEQLPSVAGNDYGVLAIPTQTQAVAPPEPASGGSVFSGLTAFLDGISGNQFSRPYGLAFWALIAGVALFGALGFVFLAIGAYLIRSMWVNTRKSATYAPPVDDYSDLMLETGAQGLSGVSPSVSPMMQKYLGVPNRPTSPFASVRKSRLAQIAQPYGGNPASSSLRDRIKSTATGAATMAKGAVASANSGLRSRMRSTASVTAPMGGASRPAGLKPSLVPLGTIKGGRAGVYASSMADASEPVGNADQPATLTDAVSSFIKWL